jgi:hypothetical protein
MRKVVFYLTGPPPSPTIHLGEDTALFVGTSVVFFGCVDQTLSELWVTVEGLNTFEYITVIKLKCLPCNRNFFSNELWESIWELLIDDLVEFLGTRK